MFTKLQKHIPTAIVVLVVMAFVHRFEPARKAVTGQ